MRITTLYICCALLAALLSLGIDVLAFRVLFGWISLAFFLVSIAYIFNRPGMFRKSVDGKFPVVMKVLFIPFLLSINIYNKIVRKYDAVPSIQKVGDGLYIGDKLTFSDIPILQDEKITAVLDVTAEFESIDWLFGSPDMTYRTIPILDLSVPTAEQVAQAVAWIHNHRRKGGKVLVHCALGRGRSALMVAAYLYSMAPEKDFRDILRELRDMRETISLNGRQLKAFARIIESHSLAIQPRAWIIANPTSGGGKWEVYQEEVIQRLSVHFLLTVHLSTKEQTLSSLAKEAVGARPDIIVVCGGDGTVSEVAAQLVGTEIPLGIIPLGTTNAFCHVLWGIKAKLTPIETAIDQIISQNVRAVDTARCNGKTVLLLAGIGFEERMMQYADTETKKESGQMAYLEGLFQAIQNEDRLRVSVTLDDEDPMEVVTRSLVVANAAPFSTVLAQGRGNPVFEDGLLDITWVDEVDGNTNAFMSLLELAAAGLLDAPLNLTVRHAQAKRVRIDANPPLPYVIDGEVFEAEPLDIEILPHSLTVLG